LVDGTVKPEGLELEFVDESAPVLFYRNLHDDDFEVSEMSLSETLIAHDRRDRWGQGRWNWTGIPLYLSRADFWLEARCNIRAGIRTMADLRGKRVAVPDYDMTAALWWRALLKDLYGIEASDIEWFNMRGRGLSHGVELGLSEDPPRGVRLHWIGHQADAAGMLDRGELDAGFGVYDAGAKPSPNVEPILADGGKDLVAEYFGRTRVFQPNHHYVIQERIAREHPWVPIALYDAFEKAKHIAYKRMGRHSTAYLYFQGDPDEQAAIFGQDPYPSGLTAMRHTLQRLERASYEQGLIRDRIDIDSLYHESTRGT
jgi:4,5-dihydroxyphthalate decarboxylase